MTIGEISEKTNLPESTLRYYEKKGLIRVSRDKMADVIMKKAILSGLNLSDA